MITVLLLQRSSTCEVVHCSAPKQSKQTAGDELNTDLANSV